MNRIARTTAQLITATGLAAAALTMSTGAAHAEDGPVIVLPPNPGDPKPMDIAQPTPAPAPQPGPQDGPKDGPKDKAPSRSPARPAPATSPSPRATPTRPAPAT